ncbi:MAG: universal stress protein [Fibrobacterales bacterium]
MKLLIPLNIDEETNLIVAYIEKLIQSIPGSELFFLHVLKPDDIKYDYDKNSTTKESYKNTFVGYKKLERIVQGFLDQSIETNDLVKKGIPHEVILKEAERLEADMIIIGASHQNAFIEAIAGSVPLKILQNSTLPVLVVPDA